jgi:hypothetical protein
MALPSYQDIYEWAHSRGLEPAPAPNKRPTKKGLGRYLRDIILDYSETDLRWQKVWYSCTAAYDAMLRHFNLRLPSTTFADDRITVASDLTYPDSKKHYDEKDENGNPTPQASVERVMRRKAERWAASK